MKKFALVLDSSCGLTKDEAEKLGWYFLPLYIKIDNVDYADGVDINPKNLFEKFALKSEVNTSMFNLKYAYDLFEKLSKEYETIIVYPISKYLSNSCDSLKMIAKEFPKLRVIESVEVSLPTLVDAIWLDDQMKKDPEKIDEYIDFLNKGSFFKSITLIPKYNKYLVKGGRLHPAAALIAKMFKIVPLIKFENGQLLKEGIGKNFYKTIDKNAIQKSKTIKADKGEVLKIFIMHSGSKKEDMENYIKNVNEYFNLDPLVIDIPSVVSIHVGPEAYALIVMKIPEYLSPIIDSTLNKIY